MKFQCVRSSTLSVRVGDVLVGRLEKCDSRFTLTKDSQIVTAINRPKFPKGASLPLTGGVWEWEVVE